MPLNWNLQSWLQGRSVGIRRRRRARKAWLPVERLEARVVPTTTTPAPGALTGVAFFETDGIVGKGATEIAVKGTTLHLTGTSTAGDTVNAQTTTDQGGKFSFTLIPAGAYQLKVDATTAIADGASTSVVITNSPVAKEMDLALRVIPTLRSFLNTSGAATAASIQSSVTLLPAGVGQTTAINYAPMLRNGASTDISVATTVASKTIDLLGVFDDPNIVTSQIQIHTSGGDVNVDLLDKDAPQTVQNFYNYATSGAYDNSIFHRLATGFVLQGGGFKFDDNTNSITATPTDPSVKNEFDGVNRSNVAGTVAMAKLGSGPDTATNQFFFNLADNHTNLDAQNGGFTVFGRLVSAADTAVVNGMSTPSATLKLFDASNATGVTPASVRGALDSLPLTGYTKGVAKTQAEITSSGNSNNKTSATFSADTSAANYEEITGVTTIVRDEALTYSIPANGNSNPTLVTPTIKDNRLTLAFTAGQTGTADIIVRATDKHGQTFDATFHVIVGL